MKLDEIKHTLIKDILSDYVYSAPEDLENKIKIRVNEAFESIKDLEVENDLLVKKHDNRSRIIVLLSGEDRTDASVSHIVIPAEMNLDEMKRLWDRSEYSTFALFLIQQGARPANEVEEYSY